MPVEVVDSMDQTPAPEIQDEIMAQLTTQPPLLREDQVAAIPKDLKGGQAWLEANRWVKQEGAPKQVKEGFLTEKMAAELMGVHPLAVKEWLEANRWVKERGIAEQKEKGWLTPEQTAQLTEYGGTYAKSMLKMNARAHEQLEKGWLKKEQIQQVWKKGPEFGHRWLAANQQVHEYLDSENPLTQEQKDELDQLDPNVAVGRISEMEESVAERALKELNS